METLPASITTEMRQRFDYEHGGVTTLLDACTICRWLDKRGHKSYSRVEDSGDLYRVWVVDLAAYYWPEDATEERWLHAV